MRPPQAAIPSRGPGDTAALAGRPGQRSSPGAGMAHRQPQSSGPRPPRPHAATPCPGDLRAPAVTRSAPGQAAPSWPPSVRPPELGRPLPTARLSGLGLPAGARAEGPLLLQTSTSARCPPGGTSAPTAASTPLGASSAAAPPRGTSWPPTAATAKVRASRGLSPSQPRSLSFPCCPGWPKPGCLGPHLLPTHRPLRGSEGG